MNGVNLIPRSRRAARRRATRLRAWMVAAPLCASLLAGAYGWLRVSWGVDTSSLAADLAKADEDIKTADREISRAKTRLAELQPQLRAARAVGDQPDWGTLLTLLADRLKDDSVLTSCVLAPAPDAAPAPGAKAAPRTGDAKTRESGRPERFTLMLTGLSRTQGSVAQFVSRLEAVGVFDRVSIVESRRSSLSGEEAVGFRVECLLSDTLPEAP